MDLNRAFHGQASICITSVLSKARICEARWQLRKLQESKFVIPIRLKQKLRSGVTQKPLEWNTTLTILSATSLSFKPPFAHGPQSPASPFQTYAALVIAGWVI
jgi:hypothetical protein